MIILKENGKIGSWFLIEHGHKKTVTGSSLGPGMRWSLSQMLYNCLDWNHDCNTSKVQYQMAYSCWLVFQNLIVYGQWMHLDYGHHCIDLVHQAKYITNKISCCMLLQQVYLSNGLSLQVTIPTKTTPPPKKGFQCFKKLTGGRISSCGDDTNWLETMTRWESFLLTFPVVCAGCRKTSGPIYCIPWGVFIFPGSMFTHVLEQNGIVALIYVLDQTENNMVFHPQQFGA